MMIKDYLFKDINKYLKKDAQIGEDILDAFSYTEKSSDSPLQL